jgi:hypothetical protein
VRGVVRYEMCGMRVVWWYMCYAWCVGVMVCGAVCGVWRGMCTM